MRVFITGGSGLLGNKVAEISVERGYETYSGYCSHKPDNGAAVSFNLGDPNSIKKIEEIKPDLIIHSAALTDVDRCETEKELAYRINAEGTKMVAEMARKLGSFLVYVSTDYVFNGERGMYTENDKTNPVNYYGYSKLMGESFCQDFCIARTCVLYGGMPATGKANFVLWLINKLRNNEEVRIVTDQYITPTLNTNLAKMLLEAGEKKLTGIFHMTGATRVSRYEFSEIIADVFGLDKSLIGKATIDEMNWQAKRPNDSSLDTSKAAKTLDEKPYELNKALKVLREEIG